MAFPEDDAKRLRALSAKFYISQPKLICALLELSDLEIERLVTEYKANREVSKTKKLAEARAARRTLMDRVKSLSAEQIEALLAQTQSTHF